MQAGNHPSFNSNSKHLKKQHTTKNRPQIALIINEDCAKAAFGTTET